MQKHSAYVELPGRVTHCHANIYLAGFGPVGRRRLGKHGTIYLRVRMLVVERGVTPSLLTYKQNLSPNRKNFGEWSNTLFRVPLLLLPLLVQDRSSSVSMSSRTKQKVIFENT